MGGPPTDNRSTSLSWRETTPTYWTRRGLRYSLVLLLDDCGRVRRLLNVGRRCCPQQPHRMMQQMTAATTPPVRGAAT